ncbi:uncharacterized protein F4812DRAFT_456947 [Daldinia caldariorum]|uniref:uncharacterized protein n=1 Tax=Daldinia caldariorum TaxID=326644 RepID=UPI002008B31A|nr:uncharacterized protein F4812DRAFT_456947 [Daldinia caldariorum]KAI1470937.1 hypothetical protein F4812DRAFT_456947 [Daldinia caldariorum]
MASDPPTSLDTNVLEKIFTKPVLLQNDKSYYLRRYFPLPKDQSWNIYQTTMEGTVTQGTIPISVFVTAPGAYICTYIETKNASIPFKARHLLKYYYQQLYGNLAGLNYIGYCDITYATARTAMLNAATTIHGLNGWKPCAVFHFGFHQVHVMRSILDSKVYTPHPAIRSTPGGGK